MLVVLALVVSVIAWPFLRPVGSGGARDGTDGEAPVRSGAARAARAEAAVDAGVIADLEAAREAKYREIRDADLDHRTGKLSDEDFEAVDRSLRAEAIRILRDLDAAHGVPTRTGS